MTDRDALLRAIIATPDEDVPRLAYADCIEIDGEIEYAEFIRVQCELARRPFECLTPSIGVVIAGKPAPCYQCRPRVSCDPRKPTDILPWCDECCARDDLMRRERALRKAHLGSWTEGLPGCLITEQCESCVDQAPDYETNAVECRRCDGLGIVFTEDRLEFRRGFLYSIDLTADDWLAHADAILARHPVVEVTLTTMPDYSVSQWIPGVYRVPGRTMAKDHVLECRLSYIDGCKWLLGEEWKQVKKWNLPSVRTLIIVDEASGVDPLPLPIIHRDFFVSQRYVEESRRPPVDTGRLRPSLPAPETLYYDVL